MENKICFEEPQLVILGKLEELTGEGGNNNDDGMGNEWSQMANNKSLEF